jgi:N-methylhydantoinase A
VVPTGAGVGSAIGFLEAPVSYEISRSLYQRLSTLAPGIVNAALVEMQAEANAIVARGAPTEKREERRMAYMRYLGQGHEIAVDLPVRALAASDTGVIRAAYEQAYEMLYGRIIPGVDIEILSWVVTIATSVPPAARSATPAAHAAPAPSGRRLVFDPGTASTVEMPIYRRASLTPGAMLSGPAVIVEDETSTVISPRFDATIDANNYIVMRRRT